MQYSMRETKKNEVQWSKRSTKPATPPVQVAIEARNLNRQRAISGEVGACLRHVRVAWGKRHEPLEMTLYVQKGGGEKKPQGGKWKKGRVLWGCMQCGQISNNIVSNESKRRMAVCR